MFIIYLFVYDVYSFKDFAFYLNLTTFSINLRFKTLTMQCHRNRLVEACVLKTVGSDERHSVLLLLLLPQLNEKCKEIFFSIAFFFVMTLKG